MCDSRKDEDYAQGVHDGQHDDGMEKFAGVFSRGFQSDEYLKGYEYGENHPPSESSSDSDNSNDDGICFISTACMKYKNLPDDCYELKALRNFRDNVLIQTNEGQLLVSEYYILAPKIIDAIKKSNTNQSLVWEKIYCQIQKIVKSIDANNNDDVIEQYKKMVINLNKEFV